jgi:hypothetical protein
MAFIEEEFPEEPIQVPPENLLYRVLDAHIHPNMSVVVTGTKAVMVGATCIIQEEFPIVKPPPLNIVEDCDQSPPNIFSQEELEIIFYIIGYMMEKLHRHTLINNYINMLFDAFSNTPSK